MPLADGLRTPRNVTEKTANAKSGDLIDLGHQEERDRSTRERMIVICHTKSIPVRI